MALIMIWIYIFHLTSEKINFNILRVIVGLEWRQIKFKIRHGNSNLNFSAGLFSFQGKVNRIQICASFFLLLKWTLNWIFPTFLMQLLSHQKIISFFVCLESKNFYNYDESKGKFVFWSIRETSRKCFFL